MEMRPSGLQAPPLSHPTHLSGSTCGEDNAGWRGEVGTPKAMHSCCIVGVKHQAMQRVGHSAAWG